MNSTVKAFEKFITRDVLYILGGGCVILSVLYYFNITLIEKPDTYIVIFGAGIAYIVGYIIQEAISFTPILTTSNFEPNKFVRWLYKKFTNHALNQNFNITNLTALLEIYPTLNDRQVEQIERTITLKQVGSTIGANWLVSSIFISLKAIESCSSFDIFIAIVLLILSIFLILISWIKGTQQMQIFHEIVETQKKNKEHNKTFGRNKLPAPSK